MTGKDILAGELCPDQPLTLAQVTSREAYRKWLNHNNMPLPRSTEVPSYQNLRKQNMITRLLWHSASDAG